MKAKLLYFVTEDWYFCSHRLPLARAARDAGFQVVVVTRAGEDAVRIRDEGFGLHSLDMRRGAFSPLHDLRTLLRLIRILRAERPAIVHNVALKPVLLGTLAGRLAGTPAIVNALAGMGYVFTSADSRARLLRRWTKLAFRMLLRSSAVRMIVQNETDREIVSSVSIGAEQITMIAGSGVDPNHLRPAPEPPGPIVAAMVSRMLRDKGVVEFVEAARIIRAKNDGVITRLAGPPDASNPSSIDEGTLKGWVAEGVMEWLGAVRDVRSVWAAAHIAVLPSYREGLPKSLLEAAACGRPLVATDVPGCRDVVVHEETGLLVPPKDPKALANAIVRLANDSALRARLGKAARQHVEKHFSVEKVVKETLSLYHASLASV